MKRILFAALLGSAAAFTAAAPAFAKDSITLGLVLEPPHLDPTAGAAAAIDEVVYANVFEGLTRIDENGAVQPALASSWTVSDDGLTYVFTLHEGVLFHDSTAFDAEDVIFTLDRALSEDSTNAQKGLFEAIDSYSATGSHEVTITLKNPAGNFLFNLGWGDAVIVAPESADNNKLVPVGTGPFMFDEWITGDSLALGRSDIYWGEPVALSNVTFRFITDPNAASAALLAGDVDAFANFPAPELMAVFEADPRFEVVIGSTEGETILSTNNAREPWSNPLVRQAIAHALDRQAIIDGAMFGYGTPIGTHFAPHHPAYVDNTGLYPFDLEMAKAKLAEAGYPEGIKGTLKLPPPSYARRGGEIIADQLGKAGIELEIIPVDWGQWLSEAFRGGDYDLTIVSHTEPQDIGIYARPEYYFAYDSAEAQALVAKLNETVGEEDRYAVMAELQNLISKDAVNGYLFQLAKHGVWDVRLQGLWKNSPVQANDLTGVFWAE